jgi:hypothetical protein
MVQQKKLTREEKKQKNREVCLDENQLRLALGKCLPDHVRPGACGNLSAFGHRLRGSKPEDFLPKGKLCKLRGALLLESERGQYEEIYCKIDPAHGICKKPDEAAPPPSAGEPPAAAPPAQQQQQKSSGNAGAVVLSSSSCCCLLLMFGGMMMMRRR